MAHVRVRTEALPPDVDEEAVNAALGALGAAVVGRLLGLHRLGLRADRVDSERLCLGLRPSQYHLIVSYAEVVP